MKQFTQLNSVLEHLQKHGKITSIEAIENYGATRLSSIILKLRRAGHVIKTVTATSKNRYGNTCNYAIYIYGGKNEVNC